MAIRDHEELMCWEILDGCNGKVHYASVNSAKLAAFRWPFFAYSFGNSELILSPLSHPHVAVHYRFEDVKDGRIQHLSFSHDAQLYVLVYTSTEEIHYKFNCKDDFTHRNKTAEELAAYEPAQIVYRMDRD